MNTISDLKKNDKFIFNDITYIVVRKFISEEKPLIAKVDHHIYDEHKFYYDGLIIEKIK